jgi:Ran-binding protein 9/10
MTNPYQHGSSGPPPEVALTGFIPRARSSYASITSGTNAAAPSSSSPSFSRLSHLLNPPYDAPEFYSSQYSSFRGHNYAMDTDRNGSSLDGVPSYLGPRSPQLPSFSRAFEMFMNGSPQDNFWSPQQRNSGFFVPSYLIGTNYIQKLEQVHLAKQAQKEGQQQAGGSATVKTGQSSTPSITAKPPSHLGMTYDLIERGSPLDGDETTAPLPTRWNKDDKHSGLEVMGEGQEVKYTASKQPGERDYETGTIRADHPIPALAGIYYFEVTILSRKRDE